MYNVICCFQTRKFQYKLIRLGCYSLVIIIMATTNNDKTIPMEDDGSFSGKDVISKKLVLRLNKVKMPKSLIKADSLELNGWHPVNFFKHTSYRNPTNNEEIQSVLIDSREFVFSVPVRQRNLVLTDVFGINEFGKALPSDRGGDLNEAIKDGVAYFPGLEFAMTESKEGPFGVIPTIEFRYSQL